MAALSLRHHMERAHGVVMPQTRGVDVGGGVPETYVVSFPWVLNFFGVSGGRVPREFSQLGKPQRALHVSSLEGEGCDHIGGPGAAPTVCTLWGAHDVVVVRDTP